MSQSRLGQVVMESSQLGTTHLAPKHTAVYCTPFLWIWMITDQSHQLHVTPQQCTHRSPHPSYCQTDSADDHATSVYKFHGDGSQSCPIAPLQDPEGPMSIQTQRLGMNQTRGRGTDAHISLIGRHTMIGITHLSKMQLKWK